MGLFAQRPQQIEQWAGLPSEPIEPSPVERLDEPFELEGAVIPDASTGVASIEIPVTPFLPDGRGIDADD